ncbi:MAG: fumarylacetoacetase [Bacteroidota bacterium]
MPANDPKLRSWVHVPAGSDFPIQNIPFGIFEKDSEKRVGIRIGDHVLDLNFLQHNGYFEGIELPRGIFRKAFLNEFLSLGKKLTSSIRNRVSELLQVGSPLETHGSVDVFLLAAELVQVCMPIEVGDYTDFYSSMQHAVNVGSMFRDPANALFPNWKHMPVGYHGRSSSVIESGVPIIRPQGQILSAEAERPAHGPTKQLDFELEMGFVTCGESVQGVPIKTEDAEKYIFGLVLLNDWSARDIQKWEYVPLGPFLSKSFATAISPWIVTLDALEPFRTEGPEQQPEVLPYLQYEGMKHFDIDLEVGITPKGTQERIVCRSNFKHLYWNMAQQLAHQTVNGCNVKSGDLYGSGTISGPDPGSYGSMLEISWGGTKPVMMKDGSERSFIQDGDTVKIRGFATRQDLKIGFGEVASEVLKPF